MRHGWGRMSEAETALGALLGLMARLRDPERGCPWDREQTFGSIAPYTIEEAYEVADAIARAAPRQLRDELADPAPHAALPARAAPHYRVPQPGPLALRPAQAARRHLRSDVSL